MQKIKITAFTLILVLVYHFLASFTTVNDNDSDSGSFCGYMNILRMICNSAVKLRSFSLMAMGSRGGCGQNLTVAGRMRTQKCNLVRSRGECGGNDAVAGRINYAKS